MKRKNPEWKEVIDDDNITEKVRIKWWVFFHITDFLCFSLPLSYLSLFTASILCIHYFLLLHYQKKKNSVFCLYWCIIHPPNQFPPVFLHKRYGYTILYPPLSIILFNTFLSLSILCMYYNPDIHLISILLHPSFNIYDIQHLLHSPFFYFPFFLLFLPL